MTDMSRRAATPSLSAALAVEVAAERFGMPVIDGPRAHLIAALHALINWLIDHPEVPCPHSVDLRHHPVMVGSTVDTAQLVELANALGGELDNNARSSWVTIPICKPEDHRVQVDLHVFAGDARADAARPL